MKFLRVALFLCAAPIGVQAAIVDRDWINSGDDLITFDSNSGLEWLDVAQYKTDSTSIVENLLLSDVNLAGFRYASMSELEALIFHVTGETVALTPHAHIAISHASSEQMVNILGITIPVSGVNPFPKTAGVLADLDAGILGNRMIAVFDWSVVNTGGSTAPTTHTSAWGHYLVRSSPVPIPAAIWLLVSALGLLGWLRRKSSSGLNSPA